MGGRCPKHISGRPTFLREQIVFSQPGSLFLVLSPRLCEHRLMMRRSMLLVLVCVAVLSGCSGSHHISVTGTRSSSHATPEGGKAPVAQHGHSCAVRVIGARILDQSGHVLYRDPGGFGTHPHLHQVRCSGPTIWVVFNNGAGIRRRPVGRCWPHLAPCIRRALLWREGTSRARLVYGPVDARRPPGRLHRLVPSLLAQEDGWAVGNEESRTHVSKLPDKGLGRV